MGRVYSLMIEYVVELVALLLIVLLLVQLYSEAEVGLYVKALVFVSWSLSFVIILILPLDIQEAAAGSPSGAIKTAWTAIYYVNFVLTWLVLPLAQEYEGAGEFTVRGRLRRSLYNNGLLIRTRAAK